MDSQKQICQEILAIMNCYREQEASDYGVSTPGGLEHMGDVWRLFRKWEALLQQPVEPPVDREQVQKRLGGLLVAAEKAVTEILDRRFVDAAMTLNSAAGLENMIRAELRRLADSGGTE